MDLARPRPPAGSRRVREALAALGGGLQGPWRVAVADPSMLPAVAPGDWLLVDPTTRTWPRRGTIVVFREPGSDLLAIKRVAARPGDHVPFAGGRLHLADDEAWLIGDADDETVAANGAGRPVDSRRYGPVQLERLVGRVWLRYAPLRRAGLLPPPPADLLLRAAAPPAPRVGS